MYCQLLNTYRLTQKKFATPTLTNKPRKPVTPTIFMLDKITEMYWSRQYLSIGKKKIYHAHSNAHNA